MKKVVDYIFVPLGLLEICFLPDVLLSLFCCAQNLKWDCW